MDFNSHETSSIPECYLSKSAIFTDDNRDCQPVSELLYPNASIGQRNASLMVRSFCSRFKLSDVAMKELYTMLHCFLPPGNNLRSAFAAVNSSKKRLAELTAAAFETTNGRVCVLKFSNLIQAVVKRNFNSITNYNADRRANDHVNDIPLEKLSFFKEVDEIAIDLVLFTDGVTFIQSSSKKNLWPIWFSIAQLPSRLRMSRKNIVLASSFVGCKKNNLRGVLGSHPRINIATT